MRLRSFILTSGFYLGQILDNITLIIGIGAFFVPAIMNVESNRKVEAGEPEGVRALAVTAD